MSAAISPSESSGAPVQVFDGESATLRAGELRVAADSLWVTCAGVSTRFARLEVLGIELQRGYARIALPERVVLETTDANVLRALGDYGYVPTVPFARSPVWVRLLIWTAALGLLMAGLFTYGTQAAVALTLPFFPPELEQKIGESALEWFEQNHEAPVTNLREGVLRSSIERIEALHPDLGPVTVLVSDLPVENAFALPGGYIVVFQGILDVMQDEDELFGLLAHELGHIQHRHGTKRLLRSAWLAFVTGVLIGDVTAVSTLLIDSGSTLVTLAHDRDEEREADRFAAEVLQSLGRDTAGLARLLDRISGDFDMGEWAAWLSSHPSTDERMRNAAAFLPGAAASPPLLTPEEWLSLKSADACLCSRADDR